MNQRTVIDDVRDQYAKVAKSGLSNGSVAARLVAAAFGYSQDQLASLPEQANMGLSCGNLLVLASVSLGEVVESVVVTDTEADLNAYANASSSGLVALATIPHPFRHCTMV